MFDEDFPPPLFFYQEEFPLDSWFRGLLHVRISKIYDPHQTCTGNQYLELE